MSDIFAMQRANGDWFAIDHDGRLRVPLFHSIHDAMMARLRNFGLLLFKPVVVDALFLKNIAPLPGEDDVDFCIIDDPFASLSSGATVGRRELENIAINGKMPLAYPAESYGSRNPEAARITLGSDRDRERTTS